MMTSFSNFLISQDDGPEIDTNFCAELAEQNEWQFYFYDANGITESDIVIEYPAGKMLPTSMIISVLTEEGVIYDGDYRHEFSIKDRVIYQNDAIVGFFRRTVA
jgi:hypothetical protein